VLEYCFKFQTVSPQGLEDRDDERPQVVQLTKNDLTAEEARKHWAEEEQAVKKSDDEGMA
jgi:hypothetical protein